MATLQDKRFLLVVGLLIILSAGFWGGSRYPALHEKAAMGTETALSGLGFSALVAIPPETPIVPRILYTTVNWTHTNRQGMTFGLLFGALLLTLFCLLQQRSFRSRWANTVLGVLVGAPLGVCANCAAPIGKAIYDAGGRVETMLAAMVSSPTLNVIILAMLFALFPPYMGLIKIGLTVGFLCVGIPLLARLVPLPTVVAGHEESSHGPHGPTASRPSRPPCVRAGDSRRGGWCAILGAICGAWYARRSR